MNRERSPFKSAAYIALVACSITMMIPFLWMISSSLKREEDVQKMEFQLIPRTTKRHIERDGERIEVRVLKRTAKIRFLEASPEEYGEIAEIDADLFHEDGDESFVKIMAVKYPVEKLEEWVRIKIAETGEVRRHVPVDEIRVDSRIDLQWQNYPKSWHSFDDKVDVFLLKKLTGFRLPFDVHIQTGFVMFYLNSIIVAVCITLGQVITCSMAAFAFSRLKFPGRDYLFFGYLATMMIPAAVTIVPLFMLMRILGWFDTYKALILPGMFSAYGTFLLRQFFMTLPRELEEAAKIDGAGFFRIYWQIAIPLSKPALATLATFTFMGAWRSFLWPLLMTNRAEMYTLPIALQQFQTFYGTHWHLMMAASIISLAPIIIVFLFNQRYFVEGVKLTGLKG